MDSHIQAALNSAWTYAPAPTPCGTPLLPRNDDGLADSDGEDERTGGTVTTSVSVSALPRLLGRYHRWILVALLALLLIWLWMPSSSSPKEEKKAATTPPSSDPVLEHSVHQT
jgi:hypothetical protein